MWWWGRPNEHHQHCSQIADEVTNAPVRLRCWPNDCVCDTACCGAAASKDETYCLGSHRDQGQRHNREESGFPRFFEELNRLGFIEGQNLVVERYSAEGRRGRHVELAREVVDTHPT